MNKYLKLYYLTALSLLFSINAYAFVPIYRMVDLGLQESDRSEALAVNDKGHVAGSYWMLGTKYYYLWNEKNGISLIDLPETATIIGLNNKGQISGNYKDSSGLERGFIWNRCIGFVDIGTLGGTFTRIYDMNDLGQIVGESECGNMSLVDGAPERHAFLWQAGCIFDLGTLEGELGLPGDRSVATSINNLGQIIGTSTFSIAHKRKFIRMNNRAVFWAKGIIQEIDNTIEPQYAAVALSINNRGEATYEDNKIGSYVFNLLTKERVQIPFAKAQSRNAHVVENGDIYLSGKDYSGNNIKTASDLAYFKKENSADDFDSESYDYVNFSTVMNNAVKTDASIWKPNSFSGAKDYNNRRWVVGSAENIYGEHHAILLIPISK